MAAPTSSRPGIAIPHALCIKSDSSAPVSSAPVYQPPVGKGQWRPSLHGPSRHSGSLRGRRQPRDRQVLAGEEVQAGAGDMPGIDAIKLAAGDRGAAVDRIDADSVLAERPGALVEA